MRHVLEKYGLVFLNCLSLTKLHLFKDFMKAAYWGGIKEECYREKILL